VDSEAEAQPRPEQLPPGHAEQLRAAVVQTFHSHHQLG